MISVYRHRQKGVYEFSTLILRNWFFKKYFSTTPCGGLYGLITKFERRRPKILLSMERDKIQFEIKKLVPQK